MANALFEGRKGQDWTNLALAAALFISPWALRFADMPMPARDAWAVSIALGILALFALSAFAAWQDWVRFVLGLWLVASPWLLGFAAARHAMWAHVVIGVLVAAMSAWAVWEYRHGPHAHA